MQILVSCALYYISAKWLRFERKISSSILWISSPTDDGQHIVIDAASILSYFFA